MLSLLNAQHLSVYAVSCTVLIRKKGQVKVESEMDYLTFLRKVGSVFSPDRIIFHLKLKKKILLQKLFIFCPHAGHGHLKIEVVPLADMFYATLNRNKNTPFLKKGNDSKLCTHFF